MMLCNYQIIFMNFIYYNQFLANFEMSQSLPFLMNMSITILLLTSIYDSKIFHFVKQSIGIS